jgi:hypothetical protein
MIQSTGIIKKDNAEYINSLINVYLNSSNKFNTILVAQLCTLDETKEQLNNLVDILTINYNVINPSFETAQIFLIDELKKVYPKVNFSIVK